MDQQKQLLYQESIKEKHIKTLQQLRNKCIPLVISACCLPLTMKESDIRELFQKYGTILNVQLIKKAGVFRGSAFIKFASLTDAEKAISQMSQKVVIPGEKSSVILRWTDFEQKRLKIGQKDSHILFAGNIPRGASTKSITQLFELIGKVESVNFNPNEFHAFINYEKKENALVAIKYFDGQAFMHSARVPIDVRFKQKKYNLYMTKKHQQDEPDPFRYILKSIYHKIDDKQKRQKSYYYNYKTQKSSFQKPVPGSRIFNMNYKCQIVKDEEPKAKYIRGPLGSNLYIYNIPFNIRETDLRHLFQRYGSVIYLLLEYEKGRSKGIAFIHYDNPQSAQKAIKQLDGYMIRGKQIKVQLNKKDIKEMNKQTEQKNDNQQ